MDPSSHNTREQLDFEQSLEALPESLRQLCLSGDSVQNLAHLIKNVIQVTSGSVEVVELAMARKQFDRVEQSWKLFSPNFHRLKKFVLDLIKYTKQYPLNAAPCSLNHCVDRAVKLSEMVLRKYTVKIKLQKDKSIQASSMDAGRIEEMIANLITHALDNLPQHTGALLITTKHLKEHRQLQLSVCDDGPALEKNVIESLAKPQERTCDMVGTGFEIPLAKLCLEQHNGYMEFESAPSGNTVHIYLPIA